MLLGRYRIPPVSPIRSTVPYTGDTGGDGKKNLERAFGLSGDTFLGVTGSERLLCGGGEVVVGDDLVEDDLAEDASAENLGNLDFPLVGEGLWGTGKWRLRRCLGESFCELWDEEETGEYGGEGELLLGDRELWKLKTRDSIIMAGLLGPPWLGLLEAVGEGARSRTGESRAVSSPRSSVRRGDEADLCTGRRST